MTRSSPRDPYFLGYRSEEQQRLQRQAHGLADEARWLFDQIGLENGARAIEIGCGPQGCLELLAERVGPTGVAVGVERSPEAPHAGSAHARGVRAVRPVWGRKP